MTISSSFYPASLIFLKFLCNHNLVLLFCFLHTKLENVCFKLSLCTKCECRLGVWWVDCHVKVKDHLFHKSAFKFGAQPCKISTIVWDSHWWSWCWCLDIILSQPKSMTPGKKATCSHAFRPPLYDWLIPVNLVIKLSKWPRHLGHQLAMLMQWLTGGLMIG